VGHLERWPVYKGFNLT